MYKVHKLNIVAVDMKNVDSSEIETVAMTKSI